MASAEHVPQVSRAKSSHTASEIRPAFLKKKNQEFMRHWFDVRRCGQHSVSNQGKNCRNSRKINSTVVLFLADKAEITGMSWQDEQSWYFFCIYPQELDMKFIASLEMEFVCLSNFCRLILMCLPFWWFHSNVLSLIPFYFGNFLRCLRRPSIQPYLSMFFP